jgi:RNA polymerase sigma-70 factor (ECF subfamily)
VFTQLPRIHLCSGFDPVREIRSQGFAPGGYSVVIVRPVGNLAIVRPHDGHTFQLVWDLSRVSAVERLCVAPLEHADGLFTYAMALTRNSVEAEDLVQETYVRAIEAMGRLREHSNVKAWLYTILRNIRLNQIRQRRTRPKLVELDAHQNAADLVIDSGRDPHVIYASKVERDQVRQAIQHLSEEFREIIVLREFADLSYQDIANLLDCPLGTVMSRLARARSELGSLLFATQTSLPTCGNAKRGKEKSRAECQRSTT